MLTIEVKESTMVRPVQDPPQKVLWSSNADLVGGRVHVTTFYFYRPNGSSNFFDAGILKEALGKVPVPFYPWAGRLGRDDNGRIEINCNGEGALFVEAQTSWAIDDLGDFTPRVELNCLAPAVDYSSGDISSYPLLVLQVTRFKCGGIALGVGIEHCAGDGLSFVHFVNSWSELVRGIGITVPPFIDRTPLRARNPPTPIFHHVEYQPPPPPSVKTSQETIKSHSGPNTPRNSIPFMTKITRDQLNILKEKSMEGESRGGCSNYSSYEVLAGHVWRCICMARGQTDDQETRFYIPVDGLTRLRPPLPPGYLGNVLFNAVPIAVARELLNNPLTYAVERVHDALTRMDDEYLRSALDYLELQPNPTVFTPGSQTTWITSWVRMPIYDADFGWGRAIHMGPTCIPCEGMTFILPSYSGDGSVSLVLSLQSQHMSIFQKILYNF